MRLLHTADVHLGARFGALGEEKAREMRQLLFVTFERVARLAIDQRAQVFLVAGDLFDRPQVGAATLARVSGIFEQLDAARIPAVLMPGTHDADVSGGVWESWSPPSSVHVLRSGAPHVKLEEQDLAVHAVVGAGARLREQLASLERDDSVRFNVLMVHGSLPMPGLTDGSPEQPIDPDALAATGMDYIALGHWHGLAEHRFGGVVAAYPGSPEPVAFDQRDAGHVLLVDLGEGAPRLTDVPVGTRRLERLVIDVASVASVESIVRAIEEKSGPEVGLEVRLAGLRPPSLLVDASELEEQLAPRFFRLRVVDESHAALEAIDPSQYPEATVIGRFVRRLEAQAEEAGGERRDEIADALALGVALLEGKREVPL